MARYGSETWARREERKRSFKKASQAQTAEAAGKRAQQSAMEQAQQMMEYEYELEERRKKPLYDLLFGTKPKGTGVWEKTTGMPAYLMSRAPLREKMGGGTPGLLRELLGGSGGGDGSRSAAIEALEGSIERRGATAQGQLSSALAKRGIFRSGASGAASAQLTAGTEAEIAGMRGQFAESEAQRRSQEEMARLSALVNLMQGLT